MPRRIAVLDLARDYLQILDRSTLWYLDDDSHRLSAFGCGTPLTYRTVWVDVFQAVRPMSRDLRIETMTSTFTAHPSLGTHQRRTSRRPSTFPWCHISSTNGSDR